MRESVAGAIQPRVIEPWLLHPQLQRLRGQPNGGGYCSCTLLLQPRRLRRDATPRGSEIITGVAAAAAAAAVTQQSLRNKYFRLEAITTFNRDNDAGWPLLERRSLKSALPGRGGRSWRRNRTP